MLLPLLRSLLPFNILLLEPRSVFSESSLTVSLVLSDVDCLSALDELRDAAGASRCFLEPSAGIPVAGLSGAGADATGKGVCSEDSTGLGCEEEALELFIWACGDNSGSIKEGIQTSDNGQSVGDRRYSCCVCYKSTRWINKEGQLTWVVRQGRFPVGRL